MGMGMGMTLACDISNPLRNLLWHTPMSVGAKCSWNLTLRCTFGRLHWIPFLRWNSKQFIQMSVHHLNFNSRVQLDQSLQKVGHYIICNGMAQVLPPFKISARKTFVEVQSSYLMFMTFNLSIVSHETTECWNTPKYSLNRWPTRIPSLSNNKS